MSGTSTRVPGGAGSSPDHPTMLPASLIFDPDAQAGRAPRTTRDWLVDVACFLLAAGVGVVLYFVLGFQERLLSGPLLFVDMGIAAAACVALWWRRRWPVTLAVALGLLGAVLALAAGAAFVALFTVAVHRRFIVVAAVAALHIGTLFSYNVVSPDPTASYLVSVGYGALSVAAVVAWGMMVRARRQLVLSLRDRAHRAEAEQQLRADQARRAERARIAREMHDVLGHRISLLSTYAGALEFRSKASPEQVSRAAGVMRDSAHQALQELREVIGVLREDGDREEGERPQPTLADLPELIEESRPAGMRVTWNNHLHDLAAVPAGTGRNAYRIAQEGLTNARKHAGGATVTLTVDGAVGAGLTVEVRNPLPVGREADPVIPGAGSGLVGLAERANLAGGRLEHGRDADGGFRLRAWLPWSA